MVNIHDRKGGPVHQAGWVASCLRNTARREGYFRSGKKEHWPNRVSRFIRLFSKLHKLIFPDSGFYASCPPIGSANMYANFLGFVWRLKLFPFLFSANLPWNIVRFKGELLLLFLFYWYLFFSILCHFLIEKYTDDLSSLYVETLWRKTNLVAAFRVSCHALSQAFLSADGFFTTVFQRMKAKYWTCMESHST